ncbi:hypothetical protein ACFL1A_02690 [Patescibacteria group bacterium]
MPKKTKKQKILAEARRIIRESKLNEENQASPTQVAKTISPKPTSPQPASYKLNKIETKIQPKNRYEPDPKEFDSIRRGLVKTMLLATGAICIELVLFWKFGNV